MTEIVLSLSPDQLKGLRVAASLVGVIVLCALLVGTIGRRRP